MMINLIDPARQGSETQEDILEISPVRYIAHASRQLLDLRIKYVWGGIGFWITDDIGL